MFLLFLSDMDIAYVLPYISTAFWAKVRLRGWTAPKQASAHRQMNPWSQYNISAFLIISHYSCAKQQVEKS